MKSPPRVISNALRWQPIFRVMRDKNKIVDSQN